MLPDLDDFAIHAISLTPQQGLGIPVALVGAVFLALGAQFQHRGVNKVESRSSSPARSGLTTNQLLSLLRRPSWVIGTLMLGLAVAFQLTSLALAPLIVVQPLGAIALVITAIVNARISKVKLERASIRAIVLCVGGIGILDPADELREVGVGDVVDDHRDDRDQPPDRDDGNLEPGERGAVDRHPHHLGGRDDRVRAVLRVPPQSVQSNHLHRQWKKDAESVGAGVLYGFVATLAKVVIDRIKTLFLPSFHIGNLEWLTVLCVLALLAAAGLGGYFVQSAYSSGPPDLVIAGLTVIDPLVAVTIGVIVLQEAAGAPLYAVIAFGVAGAIAVYGVLQLAKHHPQTRH